MCGCVCLYTHIPIHVRNALVIIRIKYMQHVRTHVSK